MSAAIIPVASTERIQWIERALALGGLALIGVTWPLWTPQNLFPRVPLIAALAELPAPLAAAATWPVIALCCVALTCAIVFGPRYRVNRLAAVTVTACFVVLVLLDQHRMQPWIVHIGFALLLAVFARPTRRLNYLIWFTASIYIYSALGKFDAQFLHTVGQDFVSVLLDPIGLKAQLVSHSTRFWLAMAFPIVELAIGIGMVIPHTRVVAGLAAMAMHTMLILILGPWGLHHAWGVLVWNALFIVLSYLLFWGRHVPRERTSTGEHEFHSKDTNVEAQAVIAHAARTFTAMDMLLMLMLLVPLGERFGWIDHWLGWALYAPHSSRVHIDISATAVPRLPNVVRPFVSCDEDAPELWCSVRADHWSLAVLAAPITPQERFQIGVARALADYVEDYEIRATVLGTASRWSGKRMKHELRDARELDAAGQNYFFNTLPSFNPIPD